MVDIHLYYFSYIEYGSVFRFAVNESEINGIENNCKRDEYCYCGFCSNRILCNTATQSDTISIFVFISMVVMSMISTMNL